MPHGYTISVLSLAVWWEQFDKVRHSNMTQIATCVCSLLVVATVFTWLMVCNVYILLSVRGDLRIRETKLPMHELELKVQGGLCTRGGIITGFCDTFSMR